MGLAVKATSDTAKDNSNLVDAHPTRELNSSPKQSYRPDNIRIALAGNPNCGKTTLFNALTGLRYKVANYPGVTVERKRGRLSLRDFPQATLLDLPGIYSLSGISEDEKIATNVLLGNISSEPQPNCIVVVLDSSNLERNLYLATQLIDCGFPIILALNMVDLAKQKGLTIHQELLAKHLDTPIVSIVAKKGTGLEQLKEELNSFLKSPNLSKKSFSWLPPSSAYKAQAQELGKLYSQLEVKNSNCSSLFFGCSLLSESIFPTTTQVTEKLAQVRQSLQNLGIDSYGAEATLRYKWITSVVARSCVFDDNFKPALAEKFDSIFTHKIWGTLTFILIMATIFQSIFLWAAAPMELISSMMSALGDFTAAHLPDGQLKSLVIDGVISGVGNVVIFIPQIAILFFCLGLLEDSGYLSRAAFVMDKLMRPFGLQGRSFIPLLSSFACAIPGILASRTISSRSLRLATIMVAPLMSCSARLPVYTLLIAAFIPAKMFWGILSLQGLVLLAMYILGIFGAAFVAWLLKLSILRGKPALFLMEMPPIRIPSLKLVLREVLDRVSTFIKSAGTTILACSIILWFLASYPRPDQNNISNRVEQSYAGQIGKTIEPLIKPLGFNWEIGVGILASFAAREVFVSTLATVYHLENQDEETTTRSLLKMLEDKKQNGSFSLISAISLMVFYVFACQCMSTLAVCRRETGSWRWTTFMFVYMTTLAYLAALFTFQVGSIFFS